MDDTAGARYGVRMIVIVSGTNRPGSNTRKLAAQIEGVYQSKGVEVQVLDLARLPLEAFLPASYAVKPSALAEFTNPILAADGLVVVTPEYNGGPPGVLKYFIDLLPFPESFERRPVCFVGLAAGVWGALRPVEQLQTIFGYRNAFIYPERIFVPGVYKALDDAGRLINPEIAARVEAQAEGFVSFVEKLRGKTLRPAAAA